MDINVYIENEKTKINVKKEIEKRSCGDPPINILKINKDALTKINPVFYSEMKALECFFEATFDLSKVNREILHVLNNKKIKELTQYDRLIGQGAYGAVGASKFLDKYNFVLKTIVTQKPNSSEKDDFLKEYLFGVAVINKFRLYCPNFCYTLGTFYCDNSKFKKNKEICAENPKKKDQYICYEEIKGNTFYSLLEKKMPLKDIFNIVFQVILALEIAQRKNNFCHYDSHFANILIQDKKSNFEIVLDDKKYSFKNTHVATIIDYSLSVMTYGDMILNTSASRETPSRKGYPVPGFDVYNILSLLVFVLNTLKRGKDSKFFEKIKEDLYAKDPYSGDRMRFGIAQSFGKVFLFNEITTISPLKVIEYLSEKFKDDEIMKGTIDISERDILYQLSPRSIFDVYSELSGVNISPPDCKIIPNSLLLITYFKLDVPIKQEYIENDKKIYIGGYKDLESKIKPIPDCKGIYNLNFKDKTLPKNALILKYLEDTNVFQDIEKYVDMIYLVRQTGTMKIYQKEIEEFMDSNVYKYYHKNNINVRNCRRWIKSLLDSLKV